MFRTARVVLSATLVVGLLAVAPVRAELPAHWVAGGFGPADQEVFPDGPTYPPQPLHFGRAVAIRDSYVLAGMAPANEVAAFARNSSNVWNRTGTLRPGEAAVDFGRTLALRGNIAVVGSRSAAYVFRRDNSVWTKILRLAPPAQDGITDFSRSLTYQDGIVVVGASGSSGGSVYVFHLNANRNQVARRVRLTAADGDSSDEFGASVSMTNDTIVVGAPFALLGNERPGATYVFRHARGQWSQRQKLLAIDGDTGDQFGRAVSIDRNMVVVGAPAADRHGDYFGTPHEYYASGAAYVFVPVNGTWVEQQKLRPTPDQHDFYLQFGSHVAMFDKYIVASARTADALGSSYDPPGVNFTYVRSGNVLTARGIAHTEVPGSSVSIANNWLLVGVAEGRCMSGCVGGARLFDLNRFQ